MEMDVTVKGCYESLYRKDCEMLSLFSEMGKSLRPSFVYPRGGACKPGSTFDISEASIDRYDREISMQRLNWLSVLRSNFPAMASEFEPVLAKAENVWVGCLAA